MGGITGVILRRGEETKSLANSLLLRLSTAPMAAFPSLLMAQRTLPVIQALRATAQRLAVQAPYQWGHMGSCNCGHLAQTITKLTKAEIHTRAMQRYGDWERQLIDYCPTSGLPIDDTIDEMLALGFTRADLTHLERLSDPTIRAVIPFERRNALRHNQRDDVVLYLRTWADLLEAELLDGIDLPSLTPTVPIHTPSRAAAAIPAGA